MSLRTATSRVARWAPTWLGVATMSLACTVEPAVESLFTDDVAPPVTEKSASLDAPLCAPAHSVCPVRATLSGSVATATRAGLTRCADLASDPENCGRCGNACGSGTRCDRGVCCAEGKKSCGDACVDLASDPKNCGACGNACGAEEVCWGGACRESCPVGWAFEGKCEAAYDVGADDLANVPAACGAGNRYNCGGGAIGFRWRDQGVSAPSQVIVAVETSVYCPMPGEGATQTVTLNELGRVIGSFEGDAQGCSCQATATERVFVLDPTSIAAYRPGAVNAVSIAGPSNCVGLQANPAWDGAFARVVVRY